MKFNLLIDCTMCEVILLLCGIIWCLLSLCYLLSVFVCFRWSGYSSRWWRGGSRGITSHLHPFLWQAPPITTRPRTTYSIMTPSGAACGTLWVHCIRIPENLSFSLFACLLHQNKKISSSDPKRGQYNLASSMLCSSILLRGLCAHIYPVCGSKVSRGHGMILITAGSVELRDLFVCVLLNERIDEP